MTCMYEIDKIYSTDRMMFIHVPNECEHAIPKPSGLFCARVVVPYYSFKNFFPRKFWNLGVINRKGDYII